MTTENQAPEGGPTLSADALADKCEAWLQAGGASNIVDAYEAGYLQCDRDQDVCDHALLAILERAGEGATVADVLDRLSTPAPAPAPAEVDEFGEFESFASEEGELMSLPNAWAKDRLSGDYVYAAMRTAWRAWKARAALANTQPKGTAEPVAWIRWEWNRSGGKSLEFFKPDELSLSDQARGVVYDPLYAQAPAPAPRASCEYCDGTGDVHRADGEWLGECNRCPAAVLHAFKNFHRLLCERFGYSHCEKDWRRDQLSLIEFVAAKIPSPAVGDAS